MVSIALGVARVVLAPLFWYVGRRDDQWSALVWDDYHVETCPDPRCSLWSSR